MYKFFILFTILTISIFSKDYTKDREVLKTINSLVKETSFSKKELLTLFKDVKVQKRSLGFFLPPKRKTKKRVTNRTTPKKKWVKNYGSWDRYITHKITPKRVKDGVSFLKKYENEFNQVEKTYGVPKEYIASIIGIESIYGGNVGNFPIFDTLTTLAFEKNRRNSFFKKQLIAFLKLSKTEKFNPKRVYGSYAGAIGLCQFMPTNYSAYGVDFNNDGRITLQKAPDAIASVANYFKKNGWKKGEEVATKVKYKGERFNSLKTGYTTSYNRYDLKGIAPYRWWNYWKNVSLIKLERKERDELWYGAKNFYVITRYNHSSYYAMAVHQLAILLKKKLNEN